MSLDVEWVPSCNFEMLAARARLYNEIRCFFRELNVLEVETPILSGRTVTDPFISSFNVAHAPIAGRDKTYLQTSPEFSMKRLLAAGSGSIYQIAKSFRVGEEGRFHNPEFTLLEWYRVGFGLHELELEIEDLLRRLYEGFGRSFSAKKISYLDLFINFTGLHPLTSDLLEMEVLARQRGLEDAAEICGRDRSRWLDFLFSQLVQPCLCKDSVYFVRPYPALLPSLALKSPNQDGWVERLEIFAAGIEIANGFHELCDPCEQSERFQRDVEARRRDGLEEVVPDERLISALESGLPDCAGVALGLDRLLMVLMRKRRLSETLSFDYSTA